MHTPVLLPNVIQGLEIKEGKKYIDATVGEGGHLKSILDKKGVVLGIDWDERQIKSLRIHLKDNKNLTLAIGNFADIESIAKKHNFYPVDGVIFDLGLSMGQINKAGRGFSYKNLTELLDMRINQNTDVTAAELINKLNEEELYDAFSKYSEEIYSRPIAQSIVKRRSIKKIATVGDLLKAIDSALQKKDEKSYARIFQALRIAVNHELENLNDGMEGALKLLKPNGRLLTITFHSIEDRIVKQFIKRHDLEIYSKTFTQNTLGPAYERSAKLRVLITN